MEGVPEFDAIITVPLPLQDIVLVLNRYVGKLRYKVYLERASCDGSDRPTHV
jgi:hypothetical protein